MDFILYIGIVIAYLLVFIVITKVWFYSARWICNNLYSGYVLIP